jgi:mediator of RNA polymerase II transcription subunit 7
MRTLVLGALSWPAHVPVTRVVISVSVLPGGVLVGPCSSSGAKSALQGPAFRRDQLSLLTRSSREATINSPSLRTNSAIDSSAIAVQVAGMAEQEAPDDEDLKLPFFPPPPRFYQNFTTENKDRLEEIKKDTGLAATDDGSPVQLSAEQILALPTELRYLIPPQPPKDSDEFKVFGEVNKVKGMDNFNKTMEMIGHGLAAQYIVRGPWEYEQLYPSTDTSSASSTLDRQRYLFRFLRSILVAYIELLGIVAVNPTSEHKDEKLKDMLTMVTNMHALINEYRPHQARETLIREMERQVERKKKEIEGVKKVKERVSEVLDGFGRDVPVEKAADKSADAVVISEKDRREEAQKHMWQAMDEILS